MNLRVIYILCLVLVNHVHGQSGDAQPLHRAQEVLTDVIIHDIFSPTTASRIYAYSNIAAYEIAIQGSKHYRSLHGQIKSFPHIPLASKKIHYGLSSVYAYLLTGKRLVYSDDMIDDSIAVILKSFKSKSIPVAIYNASVQYGKLVSDSILSWVNKDHYGETRKMRRYTLVKQEGKWSPTPPGYMAAVEPYWNKIRPLTIDSASQFRPSPALVFSRDPASPFYKEAYEVYATTKALTKEQEAIANFWDCNPFFINTGGHLNFATKKISPGGHWMLIAALACMKSNADLAKSAAAYTLTSLALFDGFICCWDEKFRSNLIRPETYINATIDENWRPLLQTPPFPEYPSGHSVISTAAALILTHMFGDHFSFDDNTEVKFGLPVRSFSSFIDASKEAAISRLYGGIHYRAAIENGQVQGRQVANWILNKIKLEQ